METVVLIVPKLTVKVNVQALKNRIHAYVGDRMIEERPDELPGLILKGELTDEDKKTITDFCEDCGFIFILHENEDDGQLSKDYLDFIV
jgi:hypothetical protein